jgi:hypothetical protein
MSNGPWVLDFRSGRPFEVRRAVDVAPTDVFQESLSHRGIDGIMNALATDRNEALSRKLYADVAGGHMKVHRGHLTEREWSALRRAFELGRYVLVPLSLGPSQALPTSPNSRYTRDLSRGFFHGVKVMCAHLLCDPKDMLSVWLYESGVSSKAWNKGGNASGLCQIMPFNLARVGWHAVGADGKPDHAAFRALTAEEQLPYAAEYYKPYRGKLTDRVQCYVATFLPAFLDSDRSMDFVLCRKDDTRRDLRAAYAGNVGFDVDHKLFITRGDLAGAIDRAQTKNAARWHEIVLRLAEP